MRNMKGIFGAFSEKMAISKILVVFAMLTLGVAGHLKGAEEAKSGEARVKKNEFRGLTKSQAKEVIKIWRVIGDQEIVTWDGKEWMAKTEAEKREAIGKARKAWREVGYQNIESVDSFVKAVDKYYRRSAQKKPEELNTKVGMVVSLNAFFGRMEK